MKLGLPVPDGFWACLLPKRPTPSSLFASHDRRLLSQDLRPECRSRPVRVFGVCGGSKKARQSFVWEVRRRIARREEKRSLWRGVLVLPQGLCHPQALSKQATVALMDVLLEVKCFPNRDFSYCAAPALQHSRVRLHQPYSYHTDRRQTHFAPPKSALTVVTSKRSSLRYFQVTCGGMPSQMRLSPSLSHVVDAGASRVYVWHGIGSSRDDRR